MSFFHVKWTAVKQVFLTRKVILWIILAILLFFIGLASFYFYLPIYIESKLFPTISQKIGTRVAGKVRRIGFTGADLGALFIGDSNKTAISIGSIRLDYSLLRLFKKHVNSIVISGLELNCEVVNRKFVIPGFGLQKLFPEQKSDENTPEVSAKDRQLPVSIGSFEVRNAVLLCGYHGQCYRLPFDLSVLTEEKSRNTFECVLKIYPRDQELIFSSKIDMPNNKASVKFHAQSFQLDRFADIVKFLPELIVAGDMDVDGSSEIQLKPSQILKSTAVFEFHNTHIDYKNVVLRNSSDAENKSLPLRMEIGGEGGQWQICISSLSSASPMPICISDVHCSVQSSQEIVESSGYFNIALERSDKNQQFPIQIIEPLHTTGGFSAKFTKTGEWGFSFSNDPLFQESLSSSKDGKLKYGMLDISSKIPNFVISGKGEKTTGTVRYATQIHDVDITMVEKDIAMKFPSVSLAGESYYRKDSTMQADAVVKFENAEVSDLGYNTNITGISGEIPFQWPCEKLEKKGKISAETVNWNTLNLGTISGIVRQNGFGIVFEGEHNNALLPGLTLNFNGEAGFSTENGFETKLKFGVPRFKSASVDIGKILPAAKGVSFGGEAGLYGDLCIDAGGTECSLNVTLQNSRLELKEKGLAIEGINHVLSIPDLMRMHSAPNQQFCFEKISVGSLTFYDGKIEFQIESPKSFLIENCGLRWCDGHVYTHAMRVSLDKTDYNSVLYCDRLNLAGVLGQFGIAKAEGDGTVSGRIPIKYEKGSLSFDNGFLYSAPGDGGTIHVGGMDALDVGIPQNTPQYSQINFVNAVLKDFNYNWVKFLLATKGEDLVLQMSLDGKPMNPLPFTYNKKLRSFSRIEATGKGGIYQPVHLDINFRLPLNKIMYYGKNINEIMNMIK